MPDVPGAAGRLIAVPLGALARRLGGKPMHPRGAVFDAVLERQGSSAPWGVAWLDERATDRGTVRLPRGAGLPAPLPDLLGLAVRIPGRNGAPIDLLLSSTGRGAVTRLIPTPRTSAAATYGSIMGYRSDTGTIRLAALSHRPQAPSEPGLLAEAVRDHGLAFTLAAARGLGRWQPFARLTVTRPFAPLDPDVRFDAVRHPPPGLVPDGPMARFRGPAYAAAQAGRDAAGHAASGRV